MINEWNFEAIFTEAFGSETREAFVEAARSKLVSIPDSTFQKLNVMQQEHFDWLTSIIEYCTSDEGLKNYLEDLNGIPPIVPIDVLVHFMPLAIKFKLGTEDWPDFDLSLSTLVERPIALKPEADINKLIKKYPHLAQTGWQTSVDYYKDYFSYTQLQILKYYVECTGSFSSRRLLNGWMQSIRS